MGYRLTILNTDRKSIPGEIDFYDSSGANVGFTAIPVGGIDIPDDAAHGWTYALVTSPGYQGLSVPYINEDTDFILIKKTSALLMFGAGALAVFVGYKLFKG